MKNVIFVMLVALAFGLSGCAGGTSNSATTPTTTSEEISSDPELTKVGYVRDELTDPALYDYLNKQSGGVSNPGTVVASGGTEKVGKTATLSINRKYEISGVAQIISDNKIRISTFNYNGSCGPIYFGLAIRNSADRPIAKLKEISVAQANSSFDLTIPSNISLIQFEMLGVYCETQEGPVASADF